MDYSAQLEQIFQALRACAFMVSFLCGMVAGIAFSKRWF